jgi:hypothetical protein
MSATTPRLPLPVLVLMLALTTEPVRVLMMLIELKQWSSLRHSTRGWVQMPTRPTLPLLPMVMQV